MNSQMKLQKRFASQISTANTLLKLDRFWFEYCRDLHHQPASSSSFAYAEGSSPFQLILTLLFFGVCWSLKTREKVNHVFVFGVSVLVALWTNCETLARWCHEYYYRELVQHQKIPAKQRWRKGNRNCWNRPAMLNFSIRLLSDPLSRNWWAKNLWMHFTYQQQICIVVMEAEPHFHPINHFNMLHRTYENMFSLRIKIASKVLTSKDHQLSQLQLTSPRRSIELNYQLKLISRQWKWLRSVHAESFFLFIIPLINGSFLNTWAFLAKKKIYSVIFYLSKKNSLKHVKEANLNNVAATVSAGRRSQPFSHPLRCSRYHWLQRRVERSNEKKWNENLCSSYKRRSSRYQRNSSILDIDRARRSWGKSKEKF